MSEKVTNKKPETEEKEEAVAKKPAAKKSEKTTEKEKKDNFIKRGGRKVKNWMSEHPFWSSAISAGVGAGAAVGIGYGGKKLIEKHRERNAYIPAEEPNPLDPNA